jgi:hypothetical protein
MPHDRFRTWQATPPGGWYEYALDGEVARARTIAQIARLATAIRSKKNLVTIGDGFAYVMEYMCPRMPDGFCVKPSAVIGVRADEVKRRTMPLFRLPSVTSDVIETRLSSCIGCPMHMTRGFCMDCTGFMSWIYAGYGGRRGALPPDHVTGVCVCDMAFAAAVATASGAPLTEGAEVKNG